MREDVERAKTKMSETLGSNREINKLPEHLSAEETVELMCSGLYGPGMGLLTLTTNRLIFLKDGWTKKIVEDFPLSKITSVQWVSGLLLGQIVIYSAGTKSLFTNVEKNAGKAITSRLRDLLASAGLDEPSQKPKLDGNSGSGVADELKKLAELRDSGILTDDEFTAEKARLLGQ